VPTRQSQEFSGRLTFRINATDLGSSFLANQERFSGICRGNQFRVCEPDLGGQINKKGRIEGHRGLGKPEGFDKSLPDPVPKSVSPAHCGGGIIHEEAIHCHDAPGDQDTKGFAHIVIYLTLEQMREERRRKNKVDGVGGYRERIESPIAAFVVDLACVGGLEEFKAVQIEMMAAPGEHFQVDIDPDVLASEGRSIELVIAKMVGKFATATANVHDRRVHLDPGLRHREEPKVFSGVYVPGLIPENVIADSDAHAQMIGREFSKIREK
jgi:hypothetical protein